MKIWVVVVPMLLAFGITYVVWMFVSAAASWAITEALIGRGGHIRQNGVIVGDRVDGELLSQWQENSASITGELWVHNLLPGASPATCYTQNEAVCRLIREQYGDPDPTAEQLGIALMISLAAAVVCGLAAWFFARRVRAG